MRAIPGLRIAASSLLVGIIVVAAFAVWLGWPAFLAVAVGAIFAVVFLLVVASLGPDTAAADAAWRLAAPDLVRDRRAPVAGEPEPAPTGGPRDGAG